MWNRIISCAIAPWDSLETMGNDVFHPLAMSSVALILVAGMQLYAFSVYVRDQRFLRRLMDRIAPRSLPPSEQAKHLLNYLRNHPQNMNEQFLVAPIFRFLRPTPRQVAEFGGDCSDRCRMIVALLALRGIRASKWALYSPELVPCHAVVEVETEKGKMVIDPLFGLWFPRGEEEFFGIEDLRNNPEILNKRIEELRASGTPEVLAVLKFYPLDTYIFTYARTINWEKTWVTRLLYSCLRTVLGDGVNRIVRPHWSEQPTLMITYGCFVAEVAFLVGRLRY